MTRRSIRRPVPVVTVFLAALGATTAGTIAAGASQAVTLGSALAVLGVTAAAGSVWLGKTTVDSGEVAR